MEKEHQEFVKRYQEEMKKAALPSEIQEKYEIIKCLKDGEESGTFLVQNCQSGKFCVIKWAGGRFRGFLQQEYKILTELTEKKFTGIPAPYSIAKEGDKVFFLREYVAGKSLFEYVEEHGCLSWKRLTEIGMEICKIVEQFQKLDNPLVHRDIKPENLILTDGGELVLVDFGTMRSYREEGKRDTFLIGSEGTAAPEQYGFRQTDKRTDVYAIGRTLWFLAAGCYQEDALKEAKISRVLRYIIEKAASFDPGKRYQSAAELKKALERCRKVRYYQTAAVTMLVCAMAVGADYYLHVSEVHMQEEVRTSGAEITEAPTSELETMQEAGITEVPKREQELSITEKYTFKEPLIEQAVRLQLGLGEEETITESMLGKITDLKIVGNEIYGPDTEVSRMTLSFAADGENIENTGQGEISDLSDLAHMKNLLHVVLGRQKIVDISPLEGLRIYELNVAENQIEEVSVLSTLPYLKRLDIGSNPAEDLDALKNCSSLETLCLDGMNIENLDFVENLPVVAMTMWVTGVKSNSLEPLAKMKNLCSLEIWLSEGEIQPEVFSKIKSLGLLSIGGYPFKDLTGFGACPQIESLDIIDGLESAEGIDRFPNVAVLSLRSEELHEITPILQAGKLEELMIDWQIIFDYSPLFQHPNLKKVYCTEQQKKEILAVDTEPRFEIIIV